MSDIIRRHTIRYPHARPTTLAYLEKRDEMTERLKKEIAASKRERSRLFQIVKRTGVLASWLLREGR